MTLIRKFAAAALAVLALAPCTQAAEPAYLHSDWLDRSVDPLSDFYQYANGGFLKANPVPPAYSSWGQFRILNEENQKFIHGLLEAAASDTHLAAGSEWRKVGDFYASGMDEAAIDKAGIAPLAGELARIDRLHSPAGLPGLLAHLQAIGVNAAFGIGQMQDFADSSRVIAALAQGGLGLPDRDYYLKDDPKFAAIRAFYAGHVGRMLVLAGVPEAQSGARAAAVVALETRLAQASMPVEQQRDPHAIYHLMAVDQLGKVAPAIDWRAYLKATQAPRLAQLNLQMPDFFAALSKEVADTPLPVWQDYLRWQLVHSFAPYLAKPFVDENFSYAQQISGAKELLPRWRRVLGATNGALGFAIGREFVAQRFPPEARAQMRELLANIRAALKDDLQTLAWMSPATRERALVKLAMIEERVGAPEKWRDYSALKVDRGPYVLNVIRANLFEDKRQLAKIGKPVDRTEWYMTPQTVNAYYDPSMNSINFPAGILQPPFFDANRPAAFNYGAIGAVIGHEITHGFDDEGSQFDGKGNLADWWAPEDKEKFKVGVKCIADLYSSYTVDGGLHLKGELVTGESIADLGGLLISWRAYQGSAARAQAKAVEGYTPEQQFFLGYGWVWAQNTRPEQARVWATTDPHPPNDKRVNGTLLNVPAFVQAWGPPGTPPAEPRCVIW